MSDWRRLSSQNASAALGYATLFTALVPWMRRRRHESERLDILAFGGVGIVAAKVYEAYLSVRHAQDFWDTCRWLLSTYGAYEAYRFDRFNLRAARYRARPDPDDPDDPLWTLLRPFSRLRLQYSWGLDPDTSGLTGDWGSRVDPAWKSRHVGFVLYEELEGFLYVMSAALLFERLGLRQRLNIAPLTALGMYKLAAERSV